MSASRGSVLSRGIGRRARAAALLASLLLAACSNGSSGAPADDGPRLALWTEFLPYDDVIAQMPFLAANRLELNLGVTKGEHSFADMERVVLAGAAWGVPVHLWPELPLAEGRWPNVRTLPVFAPFMRDMMAYVRARGLPVTTVVVDMETSLQKIDALLEAFRSGNLLPAVIGLLDDYDRALYDAGTAEFAALVDEAHAMGFKVHFTAPALVADDFGDGDRDLHRLFDMAVDGVEWDEVSYQVYRTLFWAIAGPILGGGEIWSSYYVYEYARALREVFGERAALDLGLVGGDFLGNPGYASPEALREDIRAALAAGYGIEDLDVFALDGIVLQSAPADWVRAPEGPFEPPAEDPRVTGFRTIFAIADGLLDLADL